MSPRLAALSALIEQNSSEVLMSWRAGASGAVPPDGLTEASLRALLEWTRLGDAGVLSMLLREPPWGDGDGPVAASVLIIASLERALRAAAGIKSAVLDEIDSFAMEIILNLSRDLGERLDRLQESATADELTGALNRRATLVALDDEVSRALRHDRPISVLYLDVDLLKEVNDAQGHAAGDQVLLDVVSVIRRNTRVADRLGRMGGDEFVLVLPDTVQTGAATVAGKIVSLVEATGNSVSIGVAGMPANRPGRDSLLEAADAALRRAKAEGRGRYVVAVAESD